MDISHLECRILHTLTLQCRKALFHEEKEVFFEPKGSTLSVGIFEKIWSFLDHWGNLLMWKAFKRLFGAK